MADKLYRSHSLEKSANGTSGSLTVWEDSPVSPFDVGDTFRPVANGPALTVDKVSIQDSVVGELNGKPVRQWQITIEGSNEPSSSGEAQTLVRYNFNISADEKSGSMEVVNSGDNPSITLDIGDSFSVPGIGAVSCSNVRGNDEYDDSGNHTWTVTYEGIKAKNDEDDDDTSLPETESVISYEINGSTVRSVAGEFIALRRSPTPITKKSINVYTSTEASVASPGSTYEGGIVTSENILKETIKNNGVVTGSYYKHTLEVEA